MPQDPGPRPRRLRLPSTASSRRADAMAADLRRMALDLVALHLLVREQDRLLREVHRVVQPARIAPPPSGASRHHRGRAGPATAGAAPTPPRPGALDLALVASAVAVTAAVLAGIGHHGAASERRHAGQRQRVPVAIANRLRSTKAVAPHTVSL